MASHSFSAGAAIDPATATGHLKPGFGSSIFCTGRTDMRPTNEQAKLRALSEKEASRQLQAVVRARVLQPQYSNHCANLATDFSFHSMPWPGRSGTMR